jgi:hypothetical protein
MKTLRVFSAVTISLLFLLGSRAHVVFGGDNDGIVEYPDGNWGMDIGGGYQTMPDGSMVQPSAFRQEYVNTDYGAQTREGFVVFPNFRFDDQKGPPPSEVKETYEKEIMFYASSTGPNTSMLGVSKPRKRSY